MSEETLCFSATLLLNGKSIGTAENDGHGGATFVRFNNHETEKQFDALNIGKSSEDLADELADLELEIKEKMSNVKRIRKDCSVGIAFIANDEILSNGWRTCRGERVKVETSMRTKYNNKIVLLNDLTDEQIISMI
jgi:hypothetical protein